MAEQEYNESKYGHKWTGILVAIVGAVIGSLGTVSVYLGTPVGQEAVAPDRFTGSEAASLVKRINYLETNIDSHIREHPDIENRYDRRIAVLESQITALLLNQQRILDKLDGM